MAPVGNRSFRDHEDAEQNEREHIFTLLKKQKLAPAQKAGAYIVF